MPLFRALEHPGFLEISFLDQESGNALSLAAARELAALCRRYARWRHPVVVRTRHSRLFCSGGNLSDYKKLKGKSAGLKVNREITRHLDTFGAWPVPKLAVIEGDVFGGGMELLARFDWRWSTPSVLLGFWQRRMGLATGWGGGRLWAARLGEDRVRRLLMEARLLSAAEARRLGLVDRIVSRWKMESAVSEWSQLFASGGDSLVSWSARGEARHFEKLWLGPAHRQALARWK